MNDKATLPLARVVRQTFASLLYPQVLLLLLIPILVSTLFVVGTFWLTWDFWKGLIDSGLTLMNPWWQDAISHLPHFLTELLSDLGPLSMILLIFIILTLGLPLILVLNLAITSILASTFLVQFIREKHFPNLELHGKNGFIRGVWVTISSSLLFLIGWFITLPLWLVPMGAIVIPALLTAWLNRRVCLFDALADVSTHEEMEMIKANCYGQSYRLGILTTILNYIPFAIIISPVLTMVAFTYYGLGTLQLTRNKDVVTHTNSVT